MGMESIVYGVIQGPRWPHYEVNYDDPRFEIHQKFRDKVQRNLDALASLPEQDEWPFLSRTLFSSSTNTIQTTYKSQIIHFGGSFKSIEWNWEEWLAKFEVLLSKMYWDEVQLHLLSEMYTSSFHYTWKSEENALDTKYSNPIAHWTFSGGPRTFEGT